jgi:hypothetical protein
VMFRARHASGSDGNAHGGQFEFFRLEFHAPTLIRMHDAQIDKCAAHCEPNS